MDLTYTALAIRGETMTGYDDEDVNFYDGDKISKLVEYDEISPEEAAFMEGYMEEE